MAPVLQLRDSASVIEVDVGIQNELYVFDSKPQRLYVIPDLLC